MSGATEQDGEGQPEPSVRPNEPVRFQAQRRDAVVPPIDAGARAAIVLHVTLALVLSVLHVLVREKVGLFATVYSNFLERALLAGALIGTVQVIATLLLVLVIDRLVSTVARHNLGRVLSLVRIVVMGLIALSMLFESWYTALVSLGVVSVILGFALQTPITSFIGWIYILVKNPYRVGDRIRLGDASGDVIDVGFLDTTLWELGGPFVSTDDPSGRVIRIPNSLVLSTAVYNYSAPGFPYVWNEVSLLVGYGTDLDFVSSTMETAASRQVTDRMRELIASFRQAVARSPIDPRPLDEKPAVVFRSHENTWIQATVRYLVDPRDATAVKARITREVLEVFDGEPDRVLLPKGDAR